LIRTRCSRRIHYLGSGLEARMVLGQSVVELRRVQPPNQGASVNSNGVQACAPPVDFSAHVIVGFMKSRPQALNLSVHCCL
jgi:hypothetical protein